MFWGHTRSLLLLVIIHGVCSGGIFKATCSNEICPCGESVTITCNLTNELVRIIVQKDGNKTILDSDLLAKKKLVSEDEKISIEWPDFKVMVTIFEVRFSDIHKYVLTLIAHSGYETKYIDFKVSGICDAKISENLETTEVLCEAESENNSSIVWRNNHRYVYKVTRTNEKLSQGYQLRSSLKLTEDIEKEDNRICCAVSDGVYEEKETCFQTTSAIQSPLESKKSTLSAFAVLLPIALLAAALFYLIKRRNRIRAHHLSQAHLMGHEVPGEENLTIPPLLQPQTV